MQALPLAGPMVRQPQAAPVHLVVPTPVGQEQVGQEQVGQAGQTSAQQQGQEQVGKTSAQRQGQVLAGLRRPHR